MQHLFAQHGQSPWLDNLNRGYLNDGTLTRMVSAGIRGVTANPTVFTKAIQGTNAYDEQFLSLIAQGRSVTDAYWELVVEDITQALRILQPVFDDSGGADGFVSVEVAPQIAHDTDATTAAARGLHERINRPNLMVKIPATDAGIPAIQTMIGEGHSINVTLVFSLTRYRQVIEAYLAGLERLAAGGGDLSAVHSVASFFVSRVDAEVDRLLVAAGGDQAHTLRGKAAIAQAKLAYQMFRQSLATSRWSRLQALGANPQRLLWASTSVKTLPYPDTHYVDNLIGPGTITTLPETTIEAFEDHGRLTDTLNTDVAAATETMHALAAEGISMDDVGHALERQGVSAFRESFQHVLATLTSKADRPAAA
jgi:transaldolase